METAPRTRFARRCLALVLGVCALSAAPAVGDDPKPTIKKVPIDKPDENGKSHIYVEIGGPQRRVIVDAAVVLQKGPLELFLTRENTKEHEAILAAKLDARDLHRALLLAGAIPGEPVQFDPQYKPARGQVIKVTVQYLEKGKMISVPAQQWVMDSQTKKPLAVEWVFTGSRLVKNPLEPDKPIFLANDGDLICVSNFESALLDLPIKSSKSGAELAFEANTALVPPVGTKVSVIFEPVPSPKKK